MAIIHGNSGGVQWGLSNESGMLIQSASVRATVDKNIVKDSNAEICGVIYHNQTQAYTLTGYASNYQPELGFAMSIANFSGEFSGSIFMEEVEASGTSTTFQQVAVHAMQYPAF